MFSHTVFSYSVFNVHSSSVYQPQILTSLIFAIYLYFRFVFWFYFYAQSCNYSFSLLRWLLNSLSNSFTNLCARRFPHRHLLSYIVKFYCQLLCFIFISFSLHYVTFPSVLSHILDSCPFLRLLYALSSNLLANIRFSMCWLLYFFSIYAYFIFRLFV